MADKKISALTASTTPLAGTEVLPIVQSGATVKVAVSDLTAGRAVSMSGLTVTSSGLNIATITGGTASNQGASTYYKADTTLVAAFGDTSSIMGGTPATSATIYTGSAIPLNIAVSGGNKWQFTAAGNLSALQSGNGIDFSATPGTGTSELLADYEEGDWTGTLTAATPPTVAVTATGNYTKIGRQVTVNIQFSNVSTVGAVGTLQITGLPFTPSFDALGACGKVAQSANVDSSYVANGNTSIRLVTQNALSYEAIIAVVGVYLWVSISYFV
jgi:hypothetical protein